MVGRCFPQAAVAALSSLFFFLFSFSPCCDSFVCFEEEPYGHRFLPTRRLVL